MKQRAKKKNAALPKPVTSKNPVVILKHVIKARLMKNRSATTSSSC